MAAAVYSCLTGSKIFLLKMLPAAADLANWLPLKLSKHLTKAPTISGEC